MCSGTVIAQNLIQTAAHCADGNADSYAVYTQKQLQHNSVSIVIPAPPTTRRPTTSTA
jgi:V8-like Glu-specific endopeptidase